MTAVWWSAACPMSDAALALTAAQQASIGLACGGVLATFGQRRSRPATAPVTSKLIDAAASRRRKTTITIPIA